VQPMNKFRTVFLAIATVSVLAASAACSSISPVPTVTPTPVPTAIPPVAVQPFDAARPLTVQGMERTYFIHVPSGLNDQQSVPLVFVFHGFQESGAYARTYSGLDNIADANGFVVVYPEGSGDSSARSWNAGGCCGYAKQNNVDELAFVHSIIEDVGTIARVDSQRIYSAGFSNGALLSYRLACEMSDTFAAVAPVAGVLVYSPCEPGAPVSLIDVHGMTDTVVPFDGGGLNPGTGQPFPPVEESITTWAKLDGCTGDEKVEHNGIVTRKAHEQCAPGVAVELYMVSGIGHTWPSQYVVPISQIIWDFFAAHPKP
jgi:polyhydroxybutyrate depolymerase